MKTCPRCGSPMIDLSVDWVCSNVACDKQQMREAMEWAKSQRPTAEQARREAYEHAIAIIRELRESHQRDTGECETNCDFVAAWETAEEAIKAVVAPDVCQKCGQKHDDSVDGIEPIV